MWCVVQIHESDLLLCVRFTFCLFTVSTWLNPELTSTAPDHFHRQNYNVIAPWHTTNALHITRGNTFTCTADEVRILKLFPLFLFFFSSSKAEAASSYQPWYPLQSSLLKPGNVFCMMCVCVHAFVILWAKCPQTLREKKEKSESKRSTKSLKDTFSPLPKSLLQIRAQVAGGDLNWS